MFKIAFQKQLIKEYDITEMNYMQIRIFDHKNYHNIFLLSYIQVRINGNICFWFTFDQEKNMKNTMN